MKFEARRTVREAGVYIDQGIVNLTIADFGRCCVVTGLANPGVFALEAVDCNLREPMGLSERAGPAKTDEGELQRLNRARAMNEGFGEIADGHKVTLNKGVDDVFKFWDVHRYGNQSARHGFPRVSAEISRTDPGPRARYLSRW